MSLDLSGFAKADDDTDGWYLSDLLEIIKEDVGHRIAALPPETLPEDKRLLAKLDSALSLQLDWIKENQKT